MSDDFYRAFEEKFRGPRELVKARLRVYEPFILPLREYYVTANAVDLGCGRGEWLELLREHGCGAQGVDIDDFMLSACRELGLNVYTRDAVGFLKELPGESQAVVSGFHIVEHIPFDDLQNLVKEAMRVLKPGGLLILETPNPENLVVGASSFYLDPTHQRPIPAELLAFIAEYAGFKRVKVLRLQESAELSKNKSPNLLSVLNGVSPDYAVVAQKDGPTELFDATTPAFNAEYGLSLETLANRYQQQAEAKAEQAEAKAEQAEAASNSHLMQLHAVYASKSWRITAPLRWAGATARCLTPGTLKPRVKALLQHAALYVGRRPWLKRVVLSVLNRFPGLKSRLTRVVSGTTAIQWTPPQNVPANLAELTPRARRIYADLKSAIERRQQENG